MTIPAACRSSSSTKPRRRPLTRIFAFFFVVYLDLHITNIQISIISASEHISASQTNAGNHIQIIQHSSNNDDNIRISFQLHNPQVVPFMNIWGSRCEIGDLRHVQGPAGGGVRTIDIPSSLLLGGGTSTKGRGRVLDFTTAITSNLKILQMGDSISIQIGNALDEMLLVLSQVDQLVNARTQLWEAFKGGEGGTIVAPTYGGGIHGAWRITALFSEEAYGKPTGKNAPGGGWNNQQVNSFLKHTYSYKDQKNVIVNKFDAVVFRVMQGWMKVEEITRERIVEAAEMAHNILGAETLVFLTVPFTNNIRDIQTYKNVSKINEMIWDVANKWHLTHNNSQMLVMDYGGYSNHVIWANGRNMGYDVSDPLTISDPKVFDLEGPQFLFDRLNITTWPPSIPQVCAKKPTSESLGEYCERNILFRDGMHFCAETLAARIGAAVACLLGCIYNTRGRQLNPQLTLETRMLTLRACERQCNEQFMSVKPIPESWINRTLASFSNF